MKAVVQVSEIATDHRWAREVRVFGIPVFLSRELDVRTPTEDGRKKIGFCTIGDGSLLDENEEEGIDTTLYGNRQE